MLSFPPTLVNLCGAVLDNTSLLPLLAYTWPLCGEGWVCGVSVAGPGLKCPCSMTCLQTVGEPLVLETGPEHILGREILRGCGRLPTFPVSPVRRPVPSPVGISVLSASWVGISEKDSTTSLRITAVWINVSRIQMLRDIGQYNHQCPLQLFTSKCHSDTFINILPTHMGCSSFKRC